MKKIALSEVMKLARLARIDISADEAESLRDELSQILDYVHQLSNVDTKGLEPTSQVTGLTNQTRKDEIDDYGTDRESLLKNAPATKNGYIKVKRVL